MATQIGEKLCFRTVSSYRDAILNFTVIIRPVPDIGTPTVFKTEFLEPYLVELFKAHISGRREHTLSLICKEGVKKAFPDLTLAPTDLLAIEHRMRSVFMPPVHVEVTPTGSIINGEFQSIQIKVSW